MQGMGEGFAGRGAQWQAAQARTKEAEAFAQRQASADELAADRLRKAEGLSNAQYTYGQMIRMREQGDVDGIRKVMPDHLRSLKMMGGNPAGLGQLVEVLRDPEMAGIDNYFQDMAPIMGREQGETSFSAKTVNLADGSMLQSDNRGGTRLIGADGSEITDPAMRQKAVQSAMEMERENARGLYQARAEGTATGKGQGVRQQEVIDVGLRAAQQIPILNRNKELLQELETGGFAGAGLRIKNVLGIEGADEAELTTNMARTVLGQLRDTFGAQFTEREGARLERIEAGIGKSTDGNKRIIDNLLQMAEFKAGRAIKAAKSSGDYFAAEEIDSYMNMKIAPEPEAQSSQPMGQIKILGVR